MAKITIENAKELFLEDAQKGDAFSQMGLASSYFANDMYEEGIKWVTLAAQQGKEKPHDDEVLKAQYGLGCLYLDETDRVYDDITGLYWIGEAAKHGYKDAINLLNNDGIITRVVVRFGGFQQYLSALEEEDGLAALKKAQWEARRKSYSMLEEEHETEFYSLYQRTQTDEDSFAEMAELYHRLGFPEYAADYYIRAISLDVESSKSKLGEMKEHYQRLYQSGDAEAGYILGMIAFFEEDYESAKQKLEEAYKKGIAISSLGLGHLHFYGEGVQEDTRIAKKYLREAYNLRKDMYTLQFYADCLKYGEDVVPNYHLAKILYGKLSKFDFSGWAEKNIGDLYFSEDFRDSNLLEDGRIAESYYKQSYQKGNMASCAALSELYGDKVEFYAENIGVNISNASRVNEMLDDYVFFTQKAFEAEYYDVGVSYAALYLFGFHSRVKKDVTKAWDSLKKGIDAGNLVCMCGMLNYIFDGSMPLRAETEWLKSLIDRLEEEGEEVSNYRRQYQAFVEKRNKKGGCYITTDVVAGEQKSKMIAGLLGIFLGGFGVHNFYLGYIGKAIAQFALTICFWGVGTVWGVVEGIMILSGFINKDAKGIQLKD